MRLVICRQSQTQGRHPLRFASRSIVTGIGRKCLAFLASRIEWISEPVIRLLELSLSLLSTARRLEFAVRLQQHSLALRLE